MSCNAKYFSNWKSFQHSNGIKSPQISQRSFSDELRKFILFWLILPIKEWKEKYL